jgi:Fic family protein
VGGPPPAPPGLIAGRLAILEQWMAAPSALELKPAQQGALALARVVEVMPFDDGNGRVSRLAASHVMVRAGARPPILVAADAPRLAAALQAAFQLHTEPLGALLDEAAERALDILLEAAG